MSEIEYGQTPKFTIPRKLSAVSGLIWHLNRNVFESGLMSDTDVNKVEAAIQKLADVGVIEFSDAKILEGQGEYENQLRAEIPVDRVNIQALDAICKHVSAPTPLRFDSVVRPQRDRSL